MPLHKLPLIMAFNVQENAVFIHEFSKLSLPWEGDSPPLTPSPRSVASLPRFDLRLTNPGCTTGTAIAKKYKGPCPPPLDWSKKLKGGSSGLVYSTSNNLPPNNDI